MFFKLFKRIDILPFMMKHIFEQEKGERKRKYRSGKLHASASSQQ